MANDDDGSRELREHFGHALATVDPTLEPLTVATADGALKTLAYLEEQIVRLQKLRRICEMLRVAEENSPRQSGPRRGH
jgi:hypothetical protein